LHPKLQRACRCARERLTALDGFLPHTLTDLMESWEGVTIRIQELPKRLQALSYPRARRIDLSSHLLQSTAERIACVLVHELVHVIGGTELDAEALERLAFPAEATEPSPSDYAKFRKLPIWPGTKVRRGRWFFWDEHEGSVFSRDGRMVGTFREGRSGPTLLDRIMNGIFRASSKF
jgi:hypothetical protein